MHDAYQAGGGQGSQQKVPWLDAGWRREIGGPRTR